MELNLKYSLVILMLLGSLNSQNNDYLTPNQIEIVPYRIIPSNDPSYGCWSEVELISVLNIRNEIREQLIHEIIKIELYREVSEYIKIENKSYYLLRLPINEYYNYE